jgi:hypothetical protein
MNEQTTEQAEEVQAAKIEWLEPSAIGDEYMRHERAMLPAASVPIHKAFGIAPGFNVGMLRKLAEAFKPKKIVVIEHGESGFEIRRLSNNADTNLFYFSIKPKSIKEETPILEDQKTYVLRYLSEFFDLEDSQLIKYDQNGLNFRERDCVSYTHIQRKCASLASFRKSEEGATKSINEVFDLLESEGVLRKLSDEETKELFDSTAKVYRVNKSALEQCT